MEAKEIRKFIEKRGYSTYEVSKKTGLSINGLNYFMDGTRVPQRKTLNKLEDFVILEQQIENNYNLDKEKLSLLNEKSTDYVKDYSNKDLLLAFNAIGDALLANGSAISRLMIETHNNISKLLNDSTSNQLREIKKITQEINQKLETKRT